MPQVLRKWKKHSHEQFSIIKFLLGHSVLSVILPNIILGGFWNKASSQDLFRPMCGSMHVPHTVNSVKEKLPHLHTSLLA